MISLLKIVETIDFCGGAEDEALFARYYEIQNTEHYEYHPDFKNIDEAIAYVHAQGQIEIIIEDVCNNRITREDILKNISDNTKDDDLFCLQLDDDDGPWFELSDDLLF